MSVHGWFSLQLSGTMLDTEEAIGMHVFIDWLTNFWM